MLECGSGDWSSGTMTDASIYTSGTLADHGKRLSCKLLQTEQDGSFIPASDDELTEVAHLFAEPRIEKDFVDGFLNFESENTGQFLANESFPCPVDYHQLKAGSEALGPNTITEEIVDSKYDFLDGILQGDDDVQLHSVVDDYLLDTEFSEKVLDYAPCEGPHLGDLNLDNYSQTVNKRCRGSFDISKPLSPIISVLDSVSSPNALEEMTMRELQQVFKRTFGRETNVKNKQWLKRHILFELQNLETGMSSNEGERMLTFRRSADFPGRISPFKNVPANNTIKVGQELENGSFVSRENFTNSSVGSRNSGHGPLNSRDREGAPLTHKRLRKPTRRYIEESSNLKSRSCDERLQVSSTNSRDKLRRARSHNRQHRKGFGETPLVNKKDASRGSSIQVPFVVHSWKGHPKENASALAYDSEDDMDDSEYSSPESEDYMSDSSDTRARSENGGSRRKSNRVWSLSEVTILVDAVSQYGVGKWTEIKRLFFSTSHRTSVDLKDKWRNLLRASDARLYCKREVEQGKSGSIPQSVLWRVSEIAIIYPYPREQKSKLLHASSVSPSTASTTSSEMSASRSRGTAQK